MTSNAFTHSTDLPYTQQGKAKGNPQHDPLSQSTPGRPELRATKSQMDTQYVNMLLALDSIPRMHNMLAAVFTWILLAGFVLFPGTFTSLQNARSANPGSEIERHVLDAVSQVPL